MWRCDVKTLGWAAATALAAGAGISANEAQATLIFKLETVMAEVTSPEAEAPALESESNKEGGFEFTSFLKKHDGQEGGQASGELSSTSAGEKSDAAAFAQWAQEAAHPRHAKKKGRGPNSGGGSGSGSSNGRSNGGSGNSSTNGTSGTGGNGAGGNGTGANGSGGNGGTGNNGGSGGSNNSGNGSNSGNGGGSSNGGSSSGGSSNGGSSGSGSSNTESSNSGSSNGGSSNGGSSGDGGSSPSGSDSGSAPDWNPPAPLSDTPSSGSSNNPDILPPAIDITAVPEPSTLLMGGLALMGFGLSRFRRSKKS
jgi:hypothetical protein